MKKLDRVILEIFSVIVFLESVLIICIIAKWIDISTVMRVLNIALTGYQSSKIILVLVVILLICAIKCIFFDSPENEKSKAGILMQNDNGKLLISKSTIENIVSSVIANFDSVDEEQVLIELDNSNNLIVNVNLVVSKDVIIKELTLNIQNKIKDAIKKTSDLEVKEVNVKIKNISIEKQTEK